jgi:hypothetical protein
MRPALQRLLSRPTSLELLRFLVGIPHLGELCTESQCWKPAHVSRSRGNLNSARVAAGRRAYSSIAVTARTDEVRNLEDGDSEAQAPRIHQKSKLIRADPTYKNDSTLTSNLSSNPELMNAMPVPFHTRRVQSQARPTSLQELRLKFGKWMYIISTAEALEAQSNLEDNPWHDGKLLNCKEHENDTQLWAYLLDYRQKRYGLAGVKMIWDAISTRKIRIPTQGILADTIWTTLVEAGIQKHINLEDVCGYAHDLLETYGDRWGQLYFQILHYYILFGTEAERWKWHDRLKDQHPPDDKQFVEFCKLTPSSWSKMAPVRATYIKQHRRNFYQEVVPMLRARQDFEGARTWHFWFLKKGDIPQSSKAVEQLIQHYAIYYPSTAVRLTKSLVKAGVPFADSQSLKLPEYVTDLMFSSKLPTNVEFSREFMNIIHAKTFNVSVKSYDDALGSRWLATKWISLDVSISTLHALGTDEIGPLSLQAIALREPQPSTVVSRIDQLRGLGISIGNSIYSKAIERFARTGQAEYLEGLLHSDQHPDAYEDRKVQEALLVEYAQTNRWSDYRRTLAIHLINYTSPEIEKHNLVLRTSLVKGDVLNIKQNLLQMRLQGIPVKPKTISYVLRHTLRIRREGRSPTALAQLGDDFEHDLEDGIDILQTIMRSGSFVPSTSWTEIIRRLGVTGRMDRL